MKIGTKVIVKMGMWRDKRAVVIAKKGSHANKDQLHINIHEGPKIVIAPNLLKKDETV